MVAVRIGAGEAPCRLTVLPGCGSLAAVADSPWIIRRAMPEDGAFMADMLVEAVNWSSEWQQKSRSHVLSAPGTAHYIAG
jgi:hypothetical protein